MKHARATALALLALTGLTGCSTYPGYYAPRYPAPSASADEYPYVTELRRQNDLIEREAYNRQQRELDRARERRKDDKERAKQKAERERIAEIEKRSNAFTSALACWSAEMKATREGRGSGVSPSTKCGPVPQP